MELDDQARTSFIMSLMAVAVWAILTGRILLSFRRHLERRPYILAMPVVGLLASTGTLASVIALGLQRGLIEIDIRPETLAAIAGMGRGALLMGGAIALFYYTPRGD